MTKMADSVVAWGLLLLMAAAGAWLFARAIDKGYEEYLYKRSHGWQ